MKLNNKGFAVSAVLYSLLLAFILFMIVVIASFNHSIDLVTAANDDIINGNKLVARQVIIKEKISEQNNTNIGTTELSCTNWYTDSASKKIQIQTDHKVYYWPKDFPSFDTVNGYISKDNFINIKFKPTSSGADCGSWDGVDANASILGSDNNVTIPEKFYCAYIKNTLTEEWINVHINDMCNRN